MDTSPPLATTAPVLPTLSDAPLTRLLDALPTALALVTPARLIVWCNQQFAVFAGMPLGALRGRPLGEAMACAHSTAQPTACGSAERCALCATTDTAADLAAGRACERDCRLTRQLDGRFIATDLRVWTCPVELGGQALVAVAIVDVGVEKRRQVLERTFFHDLLNTAGCLRGLLDFAGMTLDDGRAIDQEMVDNMTRIADQVVDEIVAQRQLLAAEAGNLTVQLDTGRTGALLELVASDYRRHPVGRGRHVVVAPGSADLPVVTDLTLLKRVLANLVKNALEATPVGQTVTLACTGDGGTIKLAVHNPAVMPPVVQQLIFQRSFSTRGEGRGIGTYSIKLLTEQYLGGQVAFTSTPATGTTFTVTLPALPLRP